jgi:hypothetical protein
MKWAVRQQEGVFQNSFSSRTTRDRSHGYLRTSTGTLQAPAQIFGGVNRHDFSGTRTRQLPQSGALRDVLRA